MCWNGFYYQCVNNIPWSDLQAFLVEIIPHFLFLIKKRRLSDFHHWTITLSNWQKQPPEALHKKAVLKILQFSQDHLCWSLFWDEDAIKLQVVKACNYIEKRLQHRCFPVNIAKFLITPVLKNICRWLLLKITKIDLQLVIIMVTIVKQY